MHKASLRLLPWGYIQSGLLSYIGELGSTAFVHRRFMTHRQPQLVSVQIIVDVLIGITVQSSLAYSAILLVTSMDYY